MIQGKVQDDRLSKFQIFLDSCIIQSENFLLTFLAITPQICHPEPGPELDSGINDFRVS